MCSPQQWPATPLCTDTKRQIEMFLAYAFLRPSTSRGHPWLENRGGRRVDERSSLPTLHTIASARVPLERVTSTGSQRLRPTSWSSRLQASVEASAQQLPSLHQ